MASKIVEFKPLNVRVLWGSIFAAYMWEVKNGRLLVSDEAFSAMSDIAMAVAARHFGRVLADDDEFPVKPWPHAFPPSEEE